MQEILQEEFLFGLYFSKNLSCVNSDFFILYKCNFEVNQYLDRAQNTILIQ